MANYSCFNVTSDHPMYSSPMPLIGLYTAAATLVCFLFMVCDVLLGLYNMKPWLPCRFFSLNSLTLTLLAIASKLPVDLTTSMPSAQDQLSKLSGTVLICICMGFLFPSLEAQSKSERFSNMISLSILIVTIAVNVCIQMATGVIFSFTIEHIIILSCMLLLLAVLWSSTFEMNFCLQIRLDKLRKEFKKSDNSSSMNHRLMSFCRSFYGIHPRVLASLTPHCVTIAMLTTLCTVILSQATIRSLILKELEFPCGVSDYKWSMRIVVLIQILTILFGCISTEIRWLTLVRHMDLQAFKYYTHHSLFIVDYSTGLYIFSKLHIKCLINYSRMSLMNFCQTILWGVLINGIRVGAGIMNLVALFLSIIVMTPLSCCMKITQEFDMKQWIIEKSEEDFKRWIKKCRREPPNHLIRLLPNTPPISSQYLLDKEKISCLVMVILVRIAGVLLPIPLSDSLIYALDEAFEIVHFIDKKMNNIEIRHKHAWIMAKDVWMNKNNINHWLNKKIIKPMEKRSINRGPQFQSDLGRALGILEEFRGLFDPSSGRKILLAEEYFEAFDIVYLFFTNKNEQQPYVSVNDLYVHIKEQFVDMLLFVLSKFPLAIFQHVDESSIEQSGEKARLGIKFLCTLEHLVDKVDWLFPVGTGITSLME